MENNSIFIYKLKRGMKRITANFRRKIPDDDGIFDADFDIHISDNLFVNSVHYMTESDIELNETAKNQKKAQVDIVRYTALAVCVGVFIYSGATLMSMSFGYIRAQNDNEAMKNLFYSDEISTTDLPKLKHANIGKPLQDLLSSQTQVEYTVDATNMDKLSVRASEVDQFRIRLQRLCDVNSDTYGWIKVNDTTIDEVVVQAEDNDYYLKHNFYRNKQDSGAVFTDFRNKKNVDENFNTILYGHNMLNKTMFEPIMDYLKNVEMFNSGTIELYTQDAIYRYEVFSVHVADPKYRYIQVDFATEEEYVEFLYELKEKSIHEKNVNFSPEDRIITLSTCTNYWPHNPRFAVHGRLIEVIRD